MLQLFIQVVIVSANAACVRNGIIQEFGISGVRFETGFVGPVAAGVALSPVAGGRVGIIINLETKSAILALLKSETTSITKVVNFAANSTISPESRICNTAIGARVILAWFGASPRRRFSAARCSIVGITCGN